MTPRLPRVIFAVILIGTFIAAILPNAEAPDFGDGDKINHIAAFITLSLAAAWAWPRTKLWRIALWLSALGGLIEIVQAIPFIGRDAEWGDWIADTVATVVTLTVIWVLRRLLPRL
ncbi:MULTISPECIES: teicoplanin resistance protein VanZ [Sphingosinicellaceae]|uniref:teicoplanin resistance protein VanZ n=1 Tax=Sphingosinicellaceae TaxID=2820280 RepID=UPI001C1E5388|nr:MULTISPECIES: teicoplanin resistance protein VanZ [Polymorphobacter]QYE35704.1 teicoplanin resistance protein VanZ [Polymorphobacter sp. PAMC 29334]UAJ10929.1 teicoplanin resistance protein VanZ [Polymorphobacter megasporae]